MHRWDPVNPRQLALLKRISVGEDLSGPDDVPERHSAYALRNRGLVEISKRRGTWKAVITEAGRFYLEHGYHPDHPARTPEAAETGKRKASEARPRRRSGPPDNAQSSAATAPAKRSAPYTTVTMAAKRREAAMRLMERLSSERTVLISKPSEDEIGEWRRVVDFAKRHGMVPDGHYLEKQKQWTGDLRIQLMPGTHSNSRPRIEELPAVPVPNQLRSPHPVVASLRDDERWLRMPKDLRRRSLLILQALVAEAVRRGHTVRECPISQEANSGYYYQGRYHERHYSRRDGEIQIGVGGYSYVVTIREESPQSTNDERYGRLAIELTYHFQGRQRRWADRKRWKLEDVLGAVLQELETRARDDEQRKIDEEVAKAQRKARWEEAMAAARVAATEAYYATYLTEQAATWRRVRELQEYCEELEQRINQVRSDGSGVSDAEQWLTWAQQHIERIDPFKELPAMPAPPEFSPKDLEPHLEGWSPYGPEKHHFRWR
ncbi:hypothetical protein DI270_014935 [Microbispora triticiradicis]|uniref:PE-PGRS family protein n=1 Tax=Microbispora triticiradicis TaxID=2200763 RepID=A0ABX9LK05_9ACTN|nr:hypothetical protein [Microbispora triticiradicis]RGA04316.1 hypothetical protein DI270_014935 [Microbispora triticiradicis]